MSDYMFMLESHLSADQSRVVNQVQSAASEAGVNIFLTGGALRDMLAGFPIVEVDFTVEGNGVKLGRAIAAKTGAEVLEVDENRKAAQLMFPGGVRATIGMARQEKYVKPGAKAHIQPATIHEDLRGRDFTINSVALSLGAASRGLLLDPNNGAGDIERKELRAVTNFTMYDDPIRLVRLQRFKVRLGFTIVERTLTQYANAREAGLERKIAPAVLLDELRRIASEQNAPEVARVLDEEKLLHLFLPAPEGAKPNIAGLLKLQKAKQMAPHGADLRVDHLSLFLNVMTEKLTPEEKTALEERLEMDRETAERWHKLEARAKRLERELKSAKLQKPSLLHGALWKAPGEQVFFLLMRSTERLVQDRIKNYLQKYLPAALEIPERDIAASGGQPGTPKYEKARAELIAARLDARPKKVVAPTEAPAEPAPVVQTGAFARNRG